MLDFYTEESGSVASFERSSVSHTGRVSRPAYDESRHMETFAVCFTCVCAADMMNDNTDSCAMLIVWSVPCLSPHQQKLHRIQTRFIH